MDPLARLGRTDKWFLGGGKGAVYAPPFPRFLLAPGFWDECFLADRRFPWLFTALFLDAEGQPIRFQSYHKGWRPDRLTVMHYSDDVVIRERRCVTSDNAWVAEMELVTAVRPLHVFLWSLFESGDGNARLTDLSVQNDAVLAQVRHGKSTPTALAFGASHERVSWTVSTVEPHDTSPLYETSVLPDAFDGERLPDQFGFRHDGEGKRLVHAVQHYRLDDRRPLQLVCGAGMSDRAARRSLDAAREDGAIERSQADWREYLRGVPQFESSDPYLTNAYWYRWYGMRLNTVDVVDLPIVGAPLPETFAPFVAEGVGELRRFSTASAQATLREASWMHDPSLAIGILDTLERAQWEDGSFPAVNGSLKPSTGYVPTDLMSGLRQLHLLHPGSVGKDHLGTFRRYADYLLRHCTASSDPTRPTLYGRDREVGTVEASAYAFALFFGLTLFRPKDSPYRSFWGGAHRGLGYLAYDEEENFFFNVESQNSRRIKEWTVNGLSALQAAAYLMWHNDGVALDKVVERWIANPEAFWRPKGFPDRLETGARSHPMTNWRVVEGLANVAHAAESYPLPYDHVAHYQQLAGDALMKVIRLGFHNEDPRRPNAYESYHPDTGVPSLSRGLDDTMAAPLVDLILHHAVGVDLSRLTLLEQVGPKPERFSSANVNLPKVSPLPLDVDWIECADIPHPFGAMDVRIVRGREPEVEIRPA